MQFLFIYISYVKIYIKARMEYKFSFFLGLFANAFYFFVVYLTFYVIVNEFAIIDGWTYYEMIFLYALYNLSYAIAGLFFWYTVFHMDNEVTTGNLDSYLLRPLGIIQQMACKKFGDTFIGQIVVSLIFFVIAIINLPVLHSFLSVLHICITILAGVFFQSGAMIMLGCLSFWMLKSGDLANIIYFQIPTFIHYPLSIFPEIVQFGLTYILPWGLVNYYPALILLKKAITLHDSILGYSSPLISISLFLLSLRFFDRGMRHYTGSGT